MRAFYLIVCALVGLTWTVVAVAWIASRVGLLKPGKPIPFYMGDELIDD